MKRTEILHRLATSNKLIPFYGPLSTMLGEFQALLGRTGYIEHHYRLNRRLAREIPEISDSNQNKLVKQYTNGNEAIGIYCNPYIDPVTGDRISTTMDFIIAHNPLDANQALALTQEIGQTLPDGPKRSAVLNSLSEQHPKSNFTVITFQKIIDQEGDKKKEIPEISHVTCSVTAMGDFAPNDKPSISRILSMDHNETIHIDVPEGKITIHDPHAKAKLAQDVKDASAILEYCYHLLEDARNHQPIPVKKK